jgi:hypothetical protein
MNAFVRMLGDGAKFAEQKGTIEGVQRATKDEAAITNIADQVIGTECATVILRARAKCTLQRQ